MLVVGLVSASAAISSSPRWLVFLTNQVASFHIHPFSSKFPLSTGRCSPGTSQPVGGVVGGLHLQEALPSPLLHNPAQAELGFADNCLVHLILKRSENYSSAITRCTALQISLAYWLAVHPFLVSRGLFTSTQAILIVAVPGLLQLPFGLSFGK